MYVKIVRMTRKPNKRMKRKNPNKKIEEKNKLKVKRKN